MPILTLFESNTCTRCSLSFSSTYLRFTDAQQAWHLSGAVSEFQRALDLLLFYSYSQKNDGTLHGARQADKLSHLEAYHAASVWCSPIMVLSGCSARARL